MDVEFFIRYLLAPLFTALLAGLWYMVKKQDGRIDELVNRTTVTEKDVIEIRTEIRKDIQYLAQDVKEIKDILTRK